MISMNLVPWQVFEFEQTNEGNVFIICCWEVIVIFVKFQK